MRLAVFGDIHGNLPAFGAALADMQEQSPDALICLGDVSADGAWPRECLQLLESLKCPVVLGNADEDLLRGAVFTARGFPGEREIHEIGEWGRAQLEAAELEIVRTFLPTHQQSGLLAFHGSPAGCREVIGADTPGARLEQLRAEFGSQAVWVGGHTHAPLLRTLDGGAGSGAGGWRLLNPGSVGLAYERRGGGYVNVSRAEYLLLDGERPGAGQVSFRRVPYQVQAVQDGIRSSRMPHADWWANEWVQG